MLSWSSRAQTGRHKTNRLLVFVAHWKIEFDGTKIFLENKQRKGRESNWNRSSLHARPKSLEVEAYVGLRIKGWPCSTDTNVS